MVVIESERWNRESNLGLKSRSLDSKSALETEVTHLRRNSRIWRLINNAKVLSMKASNKNEVIIKKKRSNLGEVRINPIVDKCNLIFFDIVVHSMILPNEWKENELVPGGTSGKDPTCQCRRCKRCRFDPWIRNIPRRKAWRPSTPVFLPRESQDRGDWRLTVHRVAESDTAEGTQHAC